MPKYYQDKICGYYLYFTSFCVIECMHVHASDRNVSFKELQNTRPFSFLNVQQTAGNQGFFESRQMVSIFP